jgi:hypothetical protein
MDETRVELEKLVKAAYDEGCNDGADVAEGLAAYPHWEETRAYRSVQTFRPTGPGEDKVEAVAAALRKAREAIASLPEDALGMAQIAFGTPGVDVYPIRDELLSEIDRALSHAAIAAMGHTPPEDG